MGNILKQESRMVLTLNRMNANHLYSQRHANKQSGAEEETLCGMRDSQGSNLAFVSPSPFLGLSFPPQ